MRAGYATKKAYFGIKLSGGACRGLTALIGKQVCSDKYTYYIGPCFAEGTAYVHTLCATPDLTACNQYLVKLVDLRYSKPQYIEKETAYAQRAHSLNVAPETLELDFCTYDNIPYALMLMEKYGDGTLTSLIANNRAYFDANITTICTQITQLIQTLNDNDIDHGDLHSYNILYRWNEDQTLEWKIIDYGNAAPFRNKDRSKFIIDVIDLEGQLDLRSCTYKEF